MDVRVGLLFCLVLGASWACDARLLGDSVLLRGRISGISVLKINCHDKDVKVQSLKKPPRNNKVCTLCEEFASQALGYLAENQTQTEVIDMLHQTCSRLGSFRQECITLVDYYAPLFFLEASSVQPEEFCHKVNLCQQISKVSSQLHEDPGRLWHHAVSQVLKLKDPATQDQDRKVESLKTVPRNDQVCTLCEEFTSQALDYLAENKTQSEIIDTLHQACSKMGSFKQQCITLVDYYAPLLFLEVSSVQPEELCRRVDLCQQIAMLSSQAREDSCGLCRRTVSEVLDKLKDPDTQLEIIELLLKACNSMENYVKKCKRMVFEYGPLILANAEKFLETTDICITLHACNPSTASNHEASTDAKLAMVADS